MNRTVHLLVITIGAWCCLIRVVGVMAADSKPAVTCWTAGGVTGEQTISGVVRNGCIRFSWDTAYRRHGLRGR